jgi:hypothetical protein
MISLRQIPNDPQKLDIFLHKNELGVPQSKIHLLEISLVVYPYTDEVDADQFKISPYEEYVADVESDKRSTYLPVVSQSSKFFGLFLGSIIAATFYALNVEDLFSVQSIVSVLGAYAIGKELWADVDAGLAELTKERSWRWLTQEYFYQRQDFGILQRFTQLVKTKRFGAITTLANKLDFVTHSHSKTVELLFTRVDLLHADEDIVRLGTVEFSALQDTQQLRETVMVGVKVRVSRSWGPLSFTQEYYQAVDQGTVGVVDDTENWHAGQALQRGCIGIGKIGRYTRHRLTKNSIVNFTFSS